SIGRQPLGLQTKRTGKEMWIADAETMFVRRIAETLILLFPAAGVAADAGDAARGERAFQRCYSCHSVDPNKTAKLQGPSPISRAAAVQGFVYSDAMREKGAAGLIWDAATLERYISDPQSVVPGTIMSAPPLRDEQERTDVIAYLALSGPYR